MKSDMDYPTKSGHQDRQSRVKTVVLTSVKLVMVLVSLYFFICSLTFLSESFRLLGGKNIGGNS